MTSHNLNWPRLKGGFVRDVVVAFLTLIAWPIAALWRRWRKRRWSPDAREWRTYLAVRAVLLIDAVVIVAAVALFCFFVKSCG